MEAVQNGPSGHLTTGIFGTKYALETLSRYGSAEAVYDIVNSTSFPGWGHMIDRGATTIWETWKENDNIYSNCHPMFGSVSEWFYRWLGGIRPDPGAPGFTEFILAPSIPKGLAFVHCSYHSPVGEIVSNWVQEKPGTTHFEMKIPPGSVAKVSLPVDKSQRISIAKSEDPAIPDQIKGLETGQFELNEGKYTITATLLK
jgi:alpha-L-rhamnosidase